MRSLSVLSIICISTLLVTSCKGGGSAERFADSVAYDAALSWVGSPGNYIGCPAEYDGNTYRYITDLIKSTGVSHIRERLTWSTTCPSPDSCNFGHYLQNAEYCRQQGIRISDIFHDAAPYSRVDQTLPRDMTAVYNFCKKCAETFGDSMEMWEYWNEEDIFFAPESAWEYAAGLKAAYLGWKAGGHKGLVTHGALCRDDWDFYDVTLFNNEILSYLDVFNTHFYTAPCSYGSRIARTRSFLERYGAGDLGIIMTECGTNQEGNSTLAGSMEGFTKHSQMQEKIQKEFCIKSQILSRMEGIMRNYFFVFGAYSEREGKKDWGLVRRDGTPKPAIEAFKELIDEVGEGVLAGEVSTDNENVRAFRFDMPDGSTKLAYWTRTDIDDAEDEIKEWSDDPLQASVRLDDGKDVQLVSSRFPQYVEVSASLPLKRAACPIGRIGAPAAPDKDLSVIMRADFNYDDCSLGASKSRLELSADSVRFSLEIWNLDAQPKRGSVKNTASGSIEGLPEEMELPAFGKATFDVVYRPSGDAGDAIGLVGTFSDRTTTKFYVPVFY